MTYTPEAIDSKPNGNESVISNFAIVIFVTISAALMIMLYPQKALLREAFTQQEPHAITLFYDKQLSQIYPRNTNLRIILIKQQIAGHDWEGAKQQLSILLQNQDAEIRDKAYWLQYRLNAAYAYQLSRTDPKRKSEFINAKNEALRLVEKPLDVVQLEQLSSDLLGFELPAAALKVYLRLTSLKPNNLDLYKQIAKVALYSDNHLVSGNYYFLIAGQIPNLSAKREYILAGLRAYQAGGLLDKGLAAVAKFPSAVINNDSILNFLVNYALSANRPDLAQKYVQQLLLLPQK